MDYLNVETGKPEALDHEASLEALAKGTHTPIGGRALIDKQGKLVITPDDMVKQSLDQGYNIPSQEFLTDAYHQAKYGEGLGNEVRAAGEGALRGLTLGGSDLLYSDKEGARERQARNPIAATGGEALGVIAPALVGDEAGLTGLVTKAGKGVEAALAPAALEAGAGLGAKAAFAGKGLAAKIAGEATIGAGFGAGQAVSQIGLGEIDLGHPDLAAEQIAADVGYGALTGGALGGLIGGGKIVKDIASDAGASFTGAAKKAAQVLTGVNGEALDRYIARPTEVNNALSRAQVTDNFIKAADDELLNTRLGSTEGYRILEDSKKSYPVAQITEPILAGAEKIESRGLFSPTSQQNLRKLMVMAESAENLAERNGGLIPAPQMKSLIQQLDTLAEVSGKELVGKEAQFASTVRNIRSDIDEILKNKITGVPGYAEHMAEVSRDTQAIKGIREKFRSEKGAMDLLSRIARGKDPFAERLLDKFDGNFGTTFKDDMLDSFAKEAFTKDTTNGARKGLIGAVAGSAIGGPLGAMFGGALGATADKFGTAAVKRVIDAVMAAKGVAEESKPSLLNAFVDKYGAKAVAAMEPAALAAAVSMMVKGKDETKAQIQDRQLSRLKQATESTARAVESGTRALFLPSLPVYKAPKTDKSYDPLKIYKKRVTEVQKLSVGPENMLATLHDSTVHSFEVAPNVSTSIQNTIIRGNQFLASKIPAPPAPTLPFDRPYTPSTAQVTSFNRYYDTVNQPLAVLDQLKENRLHSESVEALISVYPKLYDEMKAGVISELSKKEKTLREMPFQRRVVLSTFLGQPLDSSLVPANIAANQQILTAQQAQNDAKEAAQTNHTTQAGLKNLTVADRAKTDFQSTDA